LFPFCANYGSFVFGRIFKATISSKGFSFGRTYENQEDFGSKGRGDEAIGGKVANTRSDSRKTT